MAASKLDSLSLWSRWYDAIKTGIEGGSSPAAVVEELASDEGIAGSLFQTAMQGYMGGALFVRAIEVPETLPETLPETRSLAADARPSFLRMSFQEALRAFLNKRIVSPEQFQALTAAMQRRAFTATRLASEQVVTRAYDLLRRTLDEGGTLTQFIAAFEAGDVDLGIPGAPPGRTPTTWYLETVYRTNTQSAYGLGRLDQLEAPTVVEARPLVQYRTAGDSRVRPKHAALDGIVFDRRSDPGWRQYAPPLGYNCRCAVVTVREGRPTSSAELSGLGADPGWSGPGASGGQLSFT